MNYPLLLIDGLWTVKGLKSEYPPHEDEVLIHQYPEGDCDTNFPCPSESMHACLYGLAQCNPHLKSGDTFSNMGVQMYHIDGLHVLPTVEHTLMLEWRASHDVTQAKMAGWSRNHLMVEVFVVGKWRIMGFFTARQIELDQWKPFARERVFSNMRGLERTSKIEFYLGT